MSTMTNGRVRKSLAEQIDRLDAILDGLSENLSEAVVSAVKEAVTVAVQQAVRGVLTELLTNADFLELVKATVTPASSSPRPFPWRWSAVLSRVGAALGRAKAWAYLRRDRIRRAAPVLRQLFRAAVEKAREHWQTVRRLRNRLLTAGAVGAGVALAAYCAGPVVETAALGLGGFVLTLAVQAKMALRRMLAGTMSEV